MADELWSWDWEEINGETFANIRTGLIHDFTAGCAERGFDTAVDFFSELVDAHPTNGFVRWCFAWAICGRLIAHNRGEAQSLQNFRDAASLGSSLVEVLPDGSVKVINQVGERWILRSDGSSQRVKESPQQM
ncbi:MAG: hypothetical protein ABSD21_05315 [Rhizomicrobium sp.]